MKKVRLFFGEHGVPYHLPKNQDQEVAWAQAMGAGVLDI